jgi:hypothetical protein
MTIDVVEYQIQTDYVGYPNWIAPRRIFVIFDTVTQAITIEIRTGSGTVVESPVSGPNLYLGANGHSVVLTPSPYYQFCEETTLRKISLINSFPYATLAAFPNHNLCQIVPVCDLEIESLYTVVPTTDPDSNDGSIQVSATSSNGTIRYSLTPSFDYDSSFNESGLFNNLLPGTYTIYAKDPVGCYDSITIEVPVTVVYGVKFTGEYDDQDGNTTRINILERGYEGASTEICFSGDYPFTLDYPERTKYKAVQPSYCSIRLLEESENQFQEVITQDERKYRIDYSKDFGSGWELKWTGYVVPQVYSSPFVRSNNNYVTIKATDQLANLENEPFLDESGNKYKGEISQMSIICEILKKTGLTINIRSADDIFDIGMDENEDPLTQGFVDTRIFYGPADLATEREEDNDTCDVVLNKVINCKSGLCLFQSLGVWWLTRSENAVGDFDWKEFDLTGTQVATGSYSPLKQIVSTSEAVGLKWTERTQLRTFDPNYGKFLLVHDLSLDDNFIDEGRFEADDVIDLGNGDKAFKNWNTNIIQAGIRHGLEYVDNQDSKGAFFVDFTNVFDDQAENSAYCIEIPIESSTYSNANLLKVRFQYAAFPVFTGIPWLRLAWQVRITDGFGDHLYLQSNGGWSANYDKNDIYIDDYGKFQEYELTAAMPNQADLQGTVRISFFFHNHIGRDYGSIADLKNLLVDEDEHTVLPGKRFLVWVDNPDLIGGYTHFYELQYSDADESLPDTVRPDDFDESTNPLVWQSKGKVYIGPNAGLTKKILIDNVQISYVPFDPITSLNFDPPNEAKYEDVVNKFNKLKFEETMYLGDLPDIENAKNLYRGFLRLEDGTPTTLWHRLGIDEEKLLLSIALTDRIAQTSLPVERIESRVLLKGIYYSYIDALQYDNKRFINSRYTLNDKDLKIELSLLKMEVGEDGEPPVVVGEFSDAFSDAFNNGQ